MVHRGQRSNREIFRGQPRCHIRATRSAHSSRAAVMTFGIYAQVIRHQFITLDDGWYIRDNPMVNRGVTLAGLAWAFTTFYRANWHPLTWIAHMIDSQLFGMSAGGHLLVNALIHVANTLLVFSFLSRTTHARWPSALVAALFALHPLHVESVAWAAERKDTLSTFFGLLSLISYTRYAEENSRKWYAWTVVTLALGLLAKPMLVTWPFVMLLLDYWPLRRLSQSTAGRTSSFGLRHCCARNCRSFHCSGFVRHHFFCAVS
jgi:4-amino-4-deoxy-L-arabinose transferase and related glycosyltransferases of PMT family